ncbi:MAG: hypothetical protein DRN91_02310 [Candidatus Alkanophagales archaeon]|nr:MAG: hypothetical protein DRN91_02310 [Candidatus Alkanophagales archaeon]
MKDRILPPRFNWLPQAKKVSLPVAISRKETKYFRVIKIPLNGKRGQRAVSQLPDEDVLLFLPIQSQTAQKEKKTGTARANAPGGMSRKLRMR